MAVARPALSAAGCSQCRSMVLNLFASGIQRSPPVARRSLFSTRAQVAGALSVRPFSSLPKPNRPSSVFDTEHGQNPSASEQEPKNDGHHTVENETESVAVPWYLQVEPPTYIAPMQLPPLPEIPTDSPPLIASLLEYASEEMGLDALSLLDLRKLDPSPALGPNLFMLFGTARSERHLNVSAGRLVRWLRAKHRIHAAADGLLGPNERKTKLRRKARRAKLMGTMGTDDTDDGIRTGWICVNLGTIDRSGTESAVIDEDGRVSGFGVSHAGSTVIFQIMTEGRRAEMDLEALWTQALDRCLSPHSASVSTQGERTTTPKGKPESSLHPVEKAILSNLHRPSGFSGGRNGQSLGGPLSNHVRFYSNQQSSEPVAAEVDLLSTSSPTELARVLTYDAHQKQRLLELLQTQLEEMDVTAARQALDHKPDGSKTSFMELMDLAMETLPPTRTWKYRLAVQYKASISGIQGAVVPLGKVGLLIGELRIYAIEATRHQYLQLLTCIFSSSDKEYTLVNMALDVINTMQQRNDPIMASDVIVSIIEGASMGDRTRARELTARLEKLLFRVDTPSMKMDEQLLKRLMTAHDRQFNWEGVWNAWGVPARNLRPRSAHLYIHIFQLALASNSRRLCEQVLRRCVPEANSEDPPVLADVGLRQAALKCIDLADPSAREFSELPEDSSGHMARLRRREFAQLYRTLRLE
ncbi:hypothetical protein F5B22DRAFT_135981 [Xylaria bambusicola]|uniref:uncharacterized protein n=1 Tax=Xylaria bambusicola TaxID=326684 RepID=UPI002008C249|nr:uncharacterized protein F5B22DRAFT_135981 [Xylaria bambusicola]KAI0516875.1 hypothetical protein F5B22DRAFT_135981 [Xylaria bambusicola]